MSCSEIFPWKRFHVIQPIGGRGASRRRGVGCSVAEDVGCSVADDVGEDAEDDSDMAAIAAEKISDLYISWCLKFIL